MLNDGMSNPKQVAALEYVRLGLPLLPVHTVEDGVCSCGNPTCSKPGKHPIAKLAPKGASNAAADEATIRDWWTRYPDANIGIRCDKLCVIDVDTKGDGLQRWEELVQEHGEPLGAAIAHSGGGGKHIIYAACEEIDRATTGVNQTSIDIRTGGTYIVAAPSDHQSGGVYEWDKPLPDSLSALPKPPLWLTDWVNQSKRSCKLSGNLSGLQNEDTLATHPGASEGSRNATLVDLVSRHLLAHGHNEDLLHLATKWGQRCSPPYDAREVETVVESMATSRR